MSANAAPIRSGVPTSKGWFGAVSTKTRLSETDPPTASAAMLFPEPGRPSINKICGCRMDVCTEVARDHTIPGRRQASINLLSLDYGRTATQCNRKHGPWISSVGGNQPFDSKIPEDFFNSIG